MWYDTLSQLLFSLIFLGAGLGIATVFLARRFLTSSSSNKKSKTNEDKSTKIYLIPYNKDDNKEKERKLEVSSVVIQNPSDEEPISDETVKTIIDGIALIKDQTKEKSTDPVYSMQYQNNQEPVSVGNTSENSAPVDQILAQNQNREGSNGQEKEKTVKKAYGKFIKQSQRIVTPRKNQRKNTSIYLITTAENNNGGEPEKSSQLVQHRSKEESTVNTTKNAIVDGLALIRNQTNELLGSQEREKKSVDKDYSTPSQNNAEPVSGRNAFDNLAPVNQTPAQDPNNMILNSEEKQKTVKKTFVKKYGGENIGVVLQYPQTGDDKQVEDWNVNFKSMNESSAKSVSTNSRFVSIPSEVLANEKLNSTIYESFEEKTKYVPFKPPRIRKAFKSDTFERSKFSKNISLISSRKPAAQSTLLETNNKRIEVKALDDIPILAEDSNIQHSSFQSDHFLESRHKTAGHQLWRRYAYVFGNLFSWKKRASDRSKLIDSPCSTEHYGNKSHLIDLIEDHEANFKKYKKLK